MKYILKNQHNDNRLHIIYNFTSKYLRFNKI
jgi:hypothetical protein